ncbi:MAG: hypothetical protein ACOYM4_01090 [Nodosilinea sp.]
MFTQWLGVVFTLISVYLVNQREQIAAWVAGVSQGAETAEEAIAPAMAAPGGRRGHPARCAATR